MSYLNQPSSNWPFQQPISVYTAHYYNSQFKWVLKWRQRQLIVRSQASSVEHSTELASADWLRERLSHSPVLRVKLDPMLGAADLTAWAEACEQAGKPVFLSLPSSATLPQRYCRVGWTVKRTLDWLVALGLLVLMAPLGLGAIVLMQSQTQESIWTQAWCVGERGRLFKRWMVRPEVLAVHPWLERWGVAMLPGLVNVLRGQMSLVGACPLTLAEVAECAPAAWRRLNALPGILSDGVGRIRLLEEPKSSELRLQVERWSLRQDLRSLILLLPRLLFKA